MEYFPNTDHTLNLQIPKNLSGLINTSHREGGNPNLVFFSHFLFVNNFKLSEEVPG